jgi:hypothetical protein
MVTTRTITKREHDLGSPKHKPSKSTSRTPKRPKDQASAILEFRTQSFKNMSERLMSAITMMEFQSESFNNMSICHNPSLGFTTKARACKVVGQKWARESHFMLPGTQESVREWTPTLPSELPLWELESQSTSESSKGDCRGQNSFDWDPYIMGKILELRCLKLACMAHLGT